MNLSKGTWSSHPRVFLDSLSRLLRGGKRWKRTLGCCNLSSKLWIFATSEPHFVDSRRRNFIVLWNGRFPHVLRTQGCDGSILLRGSNTEQALQFNWRLQASRPSTPPNKLWRKPFLALTAPLMTCEFDARDSVVLLIYHAPCQQVDCSSHSHQSRSRNLSCVPVTPMLKIARHERAGWRVQIALVRWSPWWLGFHPHRNLPSPNTTIPESFEIFQSKVWNEVQMVTLSRESSESAVHHIRLTPRPGISCHPNSGSLLRSVPAGDGTTSHDSRSMLAWILPPCRFNTHYRPRTRHAFKSGSSKAMVAMSQSDVCAGQRWRAHASDRRRETSTRWCRSTFCNKWTFVSISMSIYSRKLAGKRRLYLIIWSKRPSCAESEPGNTHISLQNRGFL